MFDDFDLISAKEMQDRQKGLQDRDEIVKKVIKRVNNYLYDLSKDYQNTKGYIIFQNRYEQENRIKIISILKEKGYRIKVIEPSHYYEWGGIQISW